MRGIGAIFYTNIRGCRYIFSTSVSLMCFVTAMYNSLCGNHLFCTMFYWYLSTSRKSMLSSLTFHWSVRKAICLLANITQISFCFGNSF